MFLKDTEKFFDVDSAIDTLEKSSVFTLGFVPHTELKDTIQSWNKLNFEYIRGMVSTVKSIQDITKETLDKIADKVTQKTE